MDSPRQLTRPGGVTLGYRLWSGGPDRPLLVMLHGMASNLTRWSEFVDLTTLKDRWDILRLDLRGHAGSMARGRLDVEVWSDDIAAILDAEGRERAVILGHSLGAHVALWFGYRHPRRTLGLILVEPLFPPAAGPRMRRVRRLRPLMKLALGVIRPLNRLGLKRRRFASLDLRELDRATRAAAGGGELADHIGKRYAAPTQDIKTLPIANYLQDFRAVTGPTPPLAAIAAPVLSLVSTGRAFANPDTTRALLAQLPHGEIVTIEAHHWLPTEKPAEMRAAIEDWCGRLPGRVKSAAGT